MQAFHNGYQDEAHLRRVVDAGGHRDVIGGLWEELGALQLAFLQGEGLEPHHALLDLGCGSGRLAVKAAPYLAPGRYVGVDISQALLDAARAELAAIGCAEKIGALHCTHDFRPPAAAPPFDFVIAQSLFTHMPLDQLPAALAAVKPHMAPRGRFYATFFTAAAGETERLHEPGGVTTYADRDPFHFTVADIVAAAAGAGWRARWIGAWRHPRDQQIAAFTP